MLHLTGVGRDRDLTIEIFKLGGIVATNSKIKGWRTDLDNDRAAEMPDEILNGFIKGMFEYRVMTPEQFDLAASYTKIAPASLEAARLVLVEGHSHKHVANITGKKREDVRTWCYKILREHRGIVGCPRECQCVTVCVPDEMADEVRKMERVAFRSLEPTK